MNSVQLVPQVHWVGARDPTLRKFNLVQDLQRGTMYNAYLVQAEKNVLIDAVGSFHRDKLLKNLRSLIDLREIDYVALNRFMFDQVASWLPIINQASRAKIILAENARHVLNNSFKDLSVVIKFVGDGEKLDLGGKHLSFYHSRFAPWPDSMITYLDEEAILFSSDVMSSHYSPERLFNDEAPEFSTAFRRYYNNVFRSKTDYLMGTLNQAAKMNLNMIAPAYGPVIRHKPETYLCKYLEWSKHSLKNQKSVVLISASVYGFTELLSRGIVEQLRSMGIHVYEHHYPFNIKMALEHIEESSGIIIGSPTMDRNVIKPIWDMLYSLSKIRMRGKIGAVFGSYGWSGNAASIIENMFRQQQIIVPLPAYIIKNLPSDPDMNRAAIFAEKIGIAVEKVTECKRDNGSVFPQCESCGYICSEGVTEWGEEISVFPPYPELKCPFCRVELKA